MKYLFFLAILLSCKSGQKKLVVAHDESDTITRSNVRHDSTIINVHNSYEAGKDTIRLNKAMDKISKFPEVQAITKQINKTSKGTRSASIMVRGEFNRDTSYYHFMVGDNSQEDRYVNSFDFLLNKKTNEMKAYDPILDTILNLQDWRKARH